MKSKKKLPEFIGLKQFCKQAEFEKKDYGEKQ